MGKKCKDHYVLGPYYMVEQAANDHCYRKSGEPHLINKAQLLGSQVEGLSQLRQDSRSNTKGESRSDYRKTTAVKKSSVIIRCHLFI